MTLTPLREGKLINKVEQFTGDFGLLTFRAAELLSKTKLLHPGFVCAIMIEDIQSNDVYFYMDGQYFDNEHKKIALTPITLYDYCLN